MSFPSSDPKSNPKLLCKMVSDYSETAGATDTPSELARSSSHSVPTASPISSSSNTVISHDSDKPALSMEDFVEIEKAHFTFPERLMALLEEEKAKEAMWWLPGGNAFAIRPKIFYDSVLSKYFQGTKFESFTRKLNRWGFRRLASQQGVPSTTNAYYHKMFKRGQPALVKNMRSGSKGNSKFSEAPKPLPQMSAFLPSAAAAAAAPATASYESDEIKSVREFLTNQSIIAAREAQQVAALQLQAQQQREKEQTLLASLQFHASASSSPLLAQQNLLAMQKRARALAAQQYAALHGPESVANLREQLFSRIGMGILDTPAQQPQSQQQASTDNGLTPEQLIRLMLLREQLGGRLSNNAI